MLKIMDLIMKLGIVLAVASVPLALMLLVVGGPEGGVAGLATGVIGLVIYFLASSESLRKLSRPESNQK
jgi:multisubunit Na+/H+ antiporter MnhB subunit